jgi:HK97 family phage prohead protease
MFDDERTVTATLLSGNPIRRAGLTCRFEISDEAVNLDEAVGCPFLDNHGEALGAIDELWIEDDQLHATLSLAETIAGEAALRLIKRGEVDGISIGNSILEWREIDPGSFLVTDWELREVSLCEEPLDPGARVLGYSVDDIRERMRVRQKIAQGQGEQWCARYDDDLDEDGLIRASVRVPDRRLILYGKPELFL